MTRLDAMHFSAAMSNDAADSVGWYGGHYATLSRMNRSRPPWEKMTTARKRQEIAKNAARVQKRHERMNASLEAKWANV